MSLPVPDLDNRKFQDIVDDAKRMIPRIFPEWTNHNVSDPGVALIELFAWMSEMVIFQLNQTPDKLYTQFLNLLGVRPFAARPSTADLTFWLSAVTDQAVTVPAGTIVSATDARTSTRQLREFVTTADLRIEQPTLKAALTGYGESGLKDVFDDLRYDRDRVKVFVSEPIEPGDCFYLGFEDSLAGHVLRLDVTAVAHGVGIDPGSPPVAWEVWSGDYWVPCTVEADTTGGLNRNGQITVYVPNKHEPRTLANKRFHWLRVRYKKALKDQPTYKQSPEVYRLNVTTIGGTVLAEHSVTVAGELVGRSNGTSGQEFKLRFSSILPRRKDTEYVRTSAVAGERIVAQDWIEVDDFSMSGPLDRHFVWDEAQGVLVFGPKVRYPDGTMVQHGAVPADGAMIEVTAYRYGGGEGGNLPAGEITKLYTAIPYVARVANREPSNGGVDAEANDNVKVRGPMTLRTGQRAVTTGDFERLTLSSSQEVARSRCLRPKQGDPGGPVKVLVVPAVDKEPIDLRIDDFVLRDSLYHDVAKFLNDRRVLGTSVEVTTPYYVGVSVAALVRASPGALAAPLSDAIVTELHRYLSPLEGGPLGNGWPWDTPLTTAGLQALLTEVSGVVSVDELVLFAVDLRNGRRLGEAVQSLQLDDRSLFLSFNHQAVIK